MNKKAELEISVIPTTTRKRSRCNTRKAPDPNTNATTNEIASITGVPLS
jgi:hypothetical protein